MRTTEEIVSKIRAITNDEDIFGTIRSDLLQFLPFIDAKEFLPPEDQEELLWIQSPLDRAFVLHIMEGYMPFAWKKANTFRGLSAARSLYHYTAWIWLLGDESKFPNLLEYSHYGKPHLAAICTHYGWDHSLWDDGVRLNHEPEYEH